jgi:hypothetical protein
MGHNMEQKDNMTSIQNPDNIVISHLQLRNEHMILWKQRNQTTKNLKIRYKNK